MDDRERRAHLASLQATIARVWRDVEKELEYRIKGLTRQLIDSNSDEIRGRIKALEDLQRLPQKVHEEMQRFDNALSTEAGAAVRLDDG